MNRRTLTKLIGASVVGALPTITAASSFFPENPASPYNQKLLNYLRGVYPSLGNRLTVKEDESPRLRAYSVYIDQRLVSELCLRNSDLVGAENSLWFVETQKIFGHRVFEWLLENSDDNQIELEKLFRKISSDEWLFINPLIHRQPLNGSYLSTKTHVMSFLNSEGELRFQFLRLRNPDTQPKIAGCDMAVVEGFRHMMKNPNVDSTSLEDAKKYFDVDSVVVFNCLVHPVNRTFIKVPV